MNQRLARQRNADPRQQRQGAEQHERRQANPRDEQAGDEGRREHRHQVPLDHRDAGVGGRAGTQHGEGCGGHQQRHHRVAHHRAGHRQPEIRLTGDAAQGPRRGPRGNGRRRGQPQQAGNPGGQQGQTGQHRKAHLKRRGAEIAGGHGDPRP